MLQTVDLTLDSRPVNIDWKLSPTSFTSYDWQWLFLRSSFEMAIQAVEKTGSYATTHSWEALYTSVIALLEYFQPELKWAT